MGDVERPVAEQLTLSRDVKRACELLEKLQKSKYCELNTTLAYVPKTYEIF